MMKPIAFAGLVVGTADILAACLHYCIATGNNPVNVLYYVASGAFGDTAYTAGGRMALWGLLFHYVIAYAFTWLFFVLYYQLHLIRKMGFAAAIGYAIFMWSVTQFIVVPLSRIGAPVPFRIGSAAVAIGILIACIGIPLLLMARRAYRKKP